jgi:transposase
LKNRVNSFSNSYTNYSSEYKMSVLTYMDETGTSSAEAAAKLTFHPPLLFRIGRKSSK